jgi:hypothetical protein
MRTLGRCTATAALLLLSGTTLQAQHPQVRRGFWIGFGPGYGSLKPSCDGCGTLSSEGSWTAHLRLGGTLSSQVLLGADIAGWTKSEGGATLAIGNATAAIYFYPMPASGLFLKAGVGNSGWHGEFSGVTTTTANGAGLGLTFGAGYDLRVGRNVSLTPVGNFLWGRPGEIKTGSTVLLRGWEQTVFEFGLDVTFH